MVAVFGNRYRSTFEVTAEGISFCGARSRRRANDVAQAVGVLAGNPSAWAAGATAAASEHRFVRWADIRRLRVHRSQHTIIVMNGWRVVLRLYSDASRFVEVERLVRAHAAPDTIIDSRH